MWMSTCLVFVFGALLEYSWVNVLARRKLRAETVKSAVQAFQATSRVTPTQNNSHQEEQAKQVEGARKVSKTVIC